MRILLIFFFSSISTLLHGESLKPVLLQLDWIFNAQFAGVYQAIEQGYFLKEGLEVTVQEAPASRGVIEAVTESSQPAFGTSESNVLLSARSQGKSVVALPPMFQKSPMGWMALKSSGINSITDFAGKRVGVHVDGEKVLALALAKAGLDLQSLEIAKVGYDPAILVKGEVDLMQAYVIDEFIALQQMTEGEATIHLAADLGYLAFSQVLFTTEDIALNHPNIVFGMVTALRRGWEYAMAHPHATVDLILKKWNADLDPDYQLASLQAMESLLRPDGKDLMPWPPREAWDQRQQSFLKFGFLEQPVDLESFVFQPPPFE